MKQTVQVTILARQYTIKSEVPPEEVRRVAAFINDKIEEMTAGSHVADTLDATVLTLLNITGAYLRLNENGGEFCTGARERLELLLRRLENACPEPPAAATGGEPFALGA